METKRMMRLANRIVNPSFSSQNRRREEAELSVGEDISITFI